MGGTATRYRIAGHSALLVQAGTMSTRERGEPNSFNVIRIANGQRLTIDRMAWNPAAAAFGVCWQGAFSRRGGEWSAHASPAESTLESLTFDGIGCRG